MVNQVSEKSADVTSSQLSTDFINDLDNSFEFDENTTDKVNTVNKVSEKSADVTSSQFSIDLIDGLDEPLEFNEKNTDKVNTDPAEESSIQKEKVFIYFFFFYRFA